MNHDGSETVPDFLQHFFRELFPANHTFPAPLSSILSKREKKVMAVMVAARISLTGSARKTPRHLSAVKQGRIKISGISRMIFRRQASRRLTLA